MRRFSPVLALFLALATLPGIAAANDGGFGLGIIIGEPTGLSGKLWLTGDTALSAAAAWSFEGDDALDLHMDYIVHRFDLLPVDSGRLPFYFGIGGRVKLHESDTGLSLRVPVGLDYLFASAPLDLFFELVPMLDLAPDTDFSLNAGLGIRYFF